MDLLSFRELRCPSFPSRSLSLSFLLDLSPLSLDLLLLDLLLRSLSLDRLLDLDLDLLDFFLSLSPLDRSLDLDPLLYFFRHSYCNVSFGYILTFLFFSISDGNLYSLSVSGDVLSSL